MLGSYLLREPKTKLIGNTDDPRDKVPATAEKLVFTDLYCSRFRVQPVADQAGRPPIPLGTLTMIVILTWVGTVAAIFPLAYSLGYQAGRKQGKHEGFESALHRAIEVQRPLDILYRTLVPRRSV
jgi:hypothetical protein